ncbi:amino acid synthesis family protein [Streptomyces griseiscabiei]|uniref:Amino acid synthesis family protein n=2 Tax=Streptomyces griseiscabiei TaxID=2993540 RepID=A0ABU4L793_9ACTN|nr:amino acid synthesis family protein [Streptomyces griseiscabiei]MBZ3906338.1 amino acid synthesis family protein [Streptomyces griseiscabiei]MDX2911335.1 amino acid synthesis family protein [Streptomyces griseiscabiei]
MPESPQPNFAGYHVRKWFTQIEDTHANETGALADGDPVRKIVVAAAIHNPYAGCFSEDLSLIVADSPKLGEEFGRRVAEAAAGRPIESYGKACLVGAHGEYEHGNAFLTAIFADPVRDAVGGGKSWVPSTGKRGAPGTAIDIPLAHKDALYVRSHYDTVTTTFTDTPNPDEVVVIFAFATRGRLHARLGGIRADQVQGQDGLH